MSLGSAAENNTYFIYTTGSSRGVAGLYGGRYDFDESQSNLDLEQTTIDSLRYENSLVRGLPLRGFSYDPVSQNVLLHLEQLYSLAKAGACQNYGLEQDDFYFYNLWDLQMGPFALYDSEIYFVAQESHVENRSIILDLTIRKVTGCWEDKNTFVDPDGFHRENCSSEVASLNESIIYTSDEDLTPSIIYTIRKSIRVRGTTLLVIKHENELYFLTQIANPLLTAGQLSQFLKLLLNLF